MIKNLNCCKKNAKHLSLHPRMMIEHNKKAKDYFKY